MTDPSERMDDPAALAFQGNDEPGSEFRLGTREYDWHRHGRGQLICIDQGLVRVQTSRGAWLLPPHRAGWIPPDVDHKASVSGALRGWAVMLRKDVCADMPGEPCVLGGSELLRALVHRAAGWRDADRLQPQQARLVAVLLDEIRSSRLEALYLPMPVDRRLLALANHLIVNPAEHRTFDELAIWAGLSPRSARRLFLAQTGMSFQRWRQHARLTVALEQLAAGERVAQVTEALGYATPSNFIAMFKKAFGESPGRYFTRKRLASDFKRIVEFHRDN